MSGAGAESERLRVALRELVGARGLAGLEAAAVERRARVPVGAVQRRFGNLDACFASLWEEVDDALRRRVDAAFAAVGPWRARIRAALAVELDFLAADEPRARLYVSEAVFAGEPVRSARRAAMRRRIEMLDAGRWETADPTSVPPALAEALAGAIWQHLNRAIRAGVAARLPADLAELTYLALLPYLGSAAAATELHGRGP